MKVAVDSRMIKMSGIGTYIQNLMKNDCYDLALGNKSDILEFKNNLETIEYDSKIYGLNEQFKFPYKELKKEKIDILHIPHYNIPIFYKGKMLVTIHDLTHLIHPEFLPNKFAYFYAKYMIGKALKKAEKVIVVSENTKKDILERYKVNPEKIQVVYNGVGKEFVKKDLRQIDYLYEKFSIPRDKKILMYVGNLKPHKNLERLLQAYARIKDKEKTCLLLVGKAFENYNVLEDKEKELKINEQVIHTGIVTQEELVDLYNLSDLFVFPSLYEGFGLPVLEALACGTPVISSNTSSMPEVGGDVVDYFNPLDINEITKKMEDNINKTITDEQKTKIQQWLQQFNWENISNTVKKISEEIYENRN